MDVITDWVNGRNLIINGDIIWGGIMVSLPFLPMTIVLLYAVFIRIADKEYRCGALLLLLFLLPAAALFTPVYMVFILLVGLGRLVKPQIGWNERVLCGLLDAWNVEEFKGFVPPMLRMV